MNDPIMSGVIWTNEDDISQQLKAAFDIPKEKPNGGRMTSNTQMRQPDTPYGRQVITIRELDRDFKNNPVDAVIGAIPPHQGAEDVRQWNNNGQIDNLVASYERGERRDTLMWKNPEYQFVQLLQGYLLEHNSSGEFANISDFDDSPFHLIREETLTKSKPATSEAAGVGKFVVGELNKERQDELEYTRAVDEVLNTTAVTGRTILKPLALAMIGNGLSILREQFPFEFIGKTMEHFMHTQTAIELFAQLTGICVLLSRESKGKRYTKVVERQRIVNERIQKCHEIFKTLVFDKSNGYYVPATPKQCMDRLHTISQIRSLARRGIMYNPH